VNEAPSPVSGISEARDELHAAIMNLPCKPYDGTDAHNHYCKGHRDARHAAAELALSHPTPPPDLPSWTLTVFDGPAPEGYASWDEWVFAAKKSGAYVRAVTAEDFENKSAAPPAHPTPPLRQEACDAAASRREPLIASLRKAAKEIAEEGHAGWGNLCSDAADALAPTPDYGDPLNDLGRRIDAAASDCAITEMPDDTDVAYHAVTRHDEVLVAVKVDDFSDEPTELRVALDRLGVEWRVVQPTPAPAPHASIETTGQDERDAARYRWLRERAPFANSPRPVVWMTQSNGDDKPDSHIEWLDDDDLDAAVDAAMAPSQGDKP
jgi:hypothetical protein